MFAPRCLLAVVASVAFVAAAVAADPAPLPDGKYVISYGLSPTALIRAAVFEVKTADGKPTATLVHGGLNQFKVSGLKVEDGLVKLELSGPISWTFEGKADAMTKQVVGTLGNDQRANRAMITATDIEELTQKNTAEPLTVSDDVKQLMALRTAQNGFLAQAQREQDADKRKELLDKAKEAREKAAAEGPKLVVKIADAETEPGVLFFIIPDALGQATAQKVKAADVKKWAEKGMAAAAAHGPRAEKAALLATAGILAGQEGFGDIALPYAEKAVAGTEKGTDAQRVGALKVLAQAQAAAGKADAAKATTVTVEKLEVALDAEYKKTALGFTPEKFGGRKDKEATRVAVFEMFTGAMCPPCVAADLAFDGLEAAYTPKDLILLQYHQHIPGPDPLTNPDTIGRWDYYRKIFPQDMRGVPSSVFNGKPKAGGGGGKDRAKVKFDDYKKVIDPILEEKADVTVTGTASLHEGTVSVDATVAGKADGATVRIVLAEEEVRYLGGNGIRLHHQVVRSMFGNTDGWKVKELKGGKATASVKLDDLKKSLTAYMTKYHNETNKFSNPDRPLKFEHLKVIVLVQDDETGEILNAVQLDVGGKKN